MFHVTPDGRVVDDGSSPNANPVAGLQDAMGQAAQAPPPFSNPIATGNLPGVSEIPGASGAGLAPRPPQAMATPGASPLPFAPQLPTPDYSQVPQVKPLSTPQVQMYPTKKSARIGEIAGALGGFREGMQRSEAITDRRAANKYKTAIATIETIKNDPSLSDDVKREKIGKILNDPEVQRGARAAGVELPMEKPTTPPEKPGILKRVGGAIAAGVTGVRPQPPTGRVDVGALPQADPQDRALRALKDTQIKAAQLEAELEANLSPEYRAMRKARKEGAALTVEDSAKLKAAEDIVRARAQATLDAATTRDKAATERGRLDRESRETEGEANRISREKAARIRGASGGARQNQLGELPPETLDRVKSLARRVAEREISIQAASSLLGGVRSGLGLALEREVSALDARIVPAALTAQLNSTAESIKIIDRVENMVNQIQKAPSAEARITQSALLESFLQQQVPIMARAVGHVGVLTQQDVDSVRGFFPGWKSANFAPAYAKEKVRVMRDRFNEHKKILETESFRVIPRGGGAPAADPKTSGAAGGRPVVSVGPDGTVTIK